MKLEFMIDATERNAVAGFQKLQTFDSSDASVLEVTIATLTIAFDEADQQHRHRHSNNVSLGPSPGKTATLPTGCGIVCRSFLSALRLKPST